MPVVLEILIILVLRVFILIKLLIGEFIIINNRTFPFFIPLFAKRLPFVFHFVFGKLGMFVYLFVGLLELLGIENDFLSNFCMFSKLFWRPVSSSHFGFRVAGLVLKGI